MLINRFASIAVLATLGLSSASVFAFTGGGCNSLPPVQGGTIAGTAGGTSATCVNNSTHVSYTVPCSGLVSVPNGTYSCTNSSGVKATCTTSSTNQAVFSGSNYCPTASAGGGGDTM